MGDEVMRREKGEGRGGRRKRKRKKRKKRKRKRKKRRGLGGCVQDRETHCMRLLPRKRGHLCTAKSCSKLVCGVECMVRGRDTYHSPCPQSRPMESAR
jgi:hypothetical protein